MKQYKVVGTYGDQSWVVAVGDEYKETLLYMNKCQRVANKYMKKKQWGSVHSLDLAMVVGPDHRTLYQIVEFEVGSDEDPLKDKRQENESNDTENS